MEEAGYKLPQPLFTSTTLPDEHSAFGASRKKQVQLVSKLKKRNLLNLHVHFLLSSVLCVIFFTLSVSHLVLKHNVTECNAL